MSNAAARSFGSKSSRWGLQQPPFELERSTCSLRAATRCGQPHARSAGISDHSHRRSTCDSAHSIEPGARGPDADAGRTSTARARYWPVEVAGVDRARQNAAEPRLVVYPVQRTKLQALPIGAMRRFRCCEPRNRPVDAAMALHRCRRPSSARPKLNRTALAARCVAAPQGTQDVGRLAHWFELQAEPLATHTGSSASIRLSPSMPSHTDVDECRDRRVRNRRSSSNAGTMQRPGPNRPEARSDAAACMFGIVSRHLVPPGRRRARGPTMRCTGKCAGPQPLVPDRRRTAVGIELTAGRSATYSAPIPCGSVELVRRSATADRPAVRLRSIGKLAGGLRRITCGTAHHAFAAGRLLAPRCPG